MPSREIIISEVILAHFLRRTVFRFARIFGRAKNRAFRSNLVTRLSAGNKYFRFNPLRPGGFPASGGVMYAVA
jgi:hypothetical protein